MIFTDVHRRLSRGKGKSTVRLLAIFFLAVIILSNSAFVDALNDGKLHRLFGFRHRVAFTPHDRSKRLRLKSIATDTITADGSSKLHIINKLTHTHRIGNAQSSATHAPRFSKLRDAPKMIIIGGPASGKGTQCEFIASRYGVVHLSTGDMLREAVQSDSEVGKIAKTFMDQGELVPDDVMIKIVTERLDQEDCIERGWLLDGFPRTKVQAAHLLDIGIVPDLILLLDVPDRMLIERVTGRRLDPHTGKIYHLTFRPPPADILDRLEQRSDDTAEKAERRLEHFHANLSEIRSYLGDAIVEADGTGSASAVSKSMRRIIDHTMKKRRVKA